MEVVVAVPSDVKDVVNPVLLPGCVVSEEEVEDKEVLVLVLVLVLLLLLEEEVESTTGAKSYSRILSSHKSSFFGQFLQPVSSRRRAAAKSPASSSKRAATSQLAGLYGSAWHICWFILRVFSISPCAVVVA